MNSHDYRRWRQRRRAAWIDTNRRRKHPDAEADRLIEFAIMWAPYGGATDDEILVHFGMTKHRFTERLRQVIFESNCTQEEIHILASIRGSVISVIFGSIYLLMPMGDGVRAWLIC